jgi:Ni/Co efflux regulator RcnB
MKNKTIISALVALTLAQSGWALADDDHHHDDRRDDHHEQDHRPGPGFDRQAHDDHGYHGGHDERGAGPNHDWRRGQRLSGEYRNRQYVVDNWREHRLSPPPRGYQWVQAGGDYVLIAAATGIIAQLVLGN